jgi:hypothetical protein
MDKPSPEPKPWRALVLLLLTGLVLAADPSPGTRVEWDSPSRDAAGSLPLGNGDLAANVWVEPTGDLVLLLGKSDAWDENSTNCKLGRLRVSTGVPATGAFRIALDTEAGEVTAAWGPAGSEVRLRVWVDAHHPIIHVETDSTTPTVQTVALETWRDAERTVEPETSDLFKNLDGPPPFPTVQRPDVVEEGLSDRLRWYHANVLPDHDGVAINLGLQGLAGKVPDFVHPLQGRIFGAEVEGPGFTAAGPRRIQRPAATAHHLRLNALTRHPDTVAGWRTAIAAMASAASTRDREEDRRQHRSWWAGFWARSHLVITGPEVRAVPEAATPSEVSQAYHLCRYLNACAGRGGAPIKFNGSLFTIGRPDWPDYRRWGGPGFWFQNQRLVYGPMLAAGDADLQRPWFAMFRTALPLATARVQRWFGHEGAQFGETITFWGAEVSGHYGWTPFTERRQPHCECPYLTYYWQGNLELVTMLLDHAEYTGDRTFAASHLAPLADALLRFYEVHYHDGPDGRMAIDPGQALETWHEARNPMPEIAGLRYLLPRLLAQDILPLTPAQRERWTHLLARVPELPTRLTDNQRILAPAERFALKRNKENPELYAVFPYRLFGVGKPDLALARTTFAHREFRAVHCWNQNDVQAALLGLTDEAQRSVTLRASPQRASDFRFPAFWNHNWDWAPDVDHGGVLQLALQAMVLQPDGRRLRLLPAWPVNWDVDFRLHAPHQTVVEGTVAGGRLVRLRVEPPERLADVEVMAPFAAPNIINGL